MYKVLSQSGNPYIWPYFCSSSSTWYMNINLIYCDIITETMQYCDVTVETVNEVFQARFT